MPRTLFGLWLLIPPLVFLAPSLCAAASGDLDQSFANGGVLNFRVGPLGSTELARSVIVQRDGKILISGSQNSVYGLARVDSHGTWDMTFGSGGIVVPQPGELDLFGAAAMGLESNGRIIIGNHFFSAVRHNTNGVRDIGYGWMGRAQFAWPYSVGSMDMVVQTNDKIVFGGYVQMTAGQGPMQDVALVRYNTDGTLDGSFGNGGISTTDLGDIIDRCMRVVVQRDGKIVAASYSQDFGSTNRWMLVRYATNGALDTTFGVGGKVVAMNARPGYGEFPYALALQTDGKILLGGIHSNQFAVLRHNSDGSVDTSFGVNGRVLIQAGTRTSTCRTIGLQRNGKIVAAGHADSSWAVVLYLPDGTLDTTFNGDGIATGIAGYADDIAFQPDGKFLLAGQDVSVHAYGDFGVVRFHGDEVVVEPPVITLQPTSQIVNVGTTATFVVEAAGAVPITYAWSFNGTAIEGATSSVLSLTNVIISDEGTYSVVASNDFGVAVSSNAFLNVNRLPIANADATRRVAISANGSNAVVKLDGSLSFDPDAELLTYSWFLNGGLDPIAIGAVTTVTLPLGVQTMELKVSDGFAMDTTTVTIEVITYAEALRRLSAEVKASNFKPGVKYLLRTPLARALRFFDHNRIRQGVARLERFQRRVQRMVAPHQPELAALWNHEAQVVIDAMNLSNAILP